jgi:hypothetical protein
LAGSGRKERKGKGRELGGFSGVRRRPAGQGRRRKEGGGVGADRWGPPVGAAEKEKERGKTVGRRGKVGWAVWAERVRVLVLFFFFFFSNLIFKSIFKPNSKQTFANLSQIFYSLFRDHSSKQNHASQMMMHIHFLELNF